jgi:hypothetical protein
MQNPCFVPDKNEIKENRNLAFAIQLGTSAEIILEKPGNIDGVGIPLRTPLLVVNPAKKENRTLTKLTKIG